MKKQSLIFYLLFLAISSFAQEADNAQPQKEMRNIYIGKAIRAISAHLDIASPIMGVVNHRSVKTFEFQADINLYNKFYPTLEGGFGLINAVLPKGQSYSGSAPFFRIGINYSLLRNATDDGKSLRILSYPFIGVRYGMGLINFDLKNIAVGSNYWDDRKIVNFLDRAAYSGWAELVAGLRVDIYKGFTMGWSVRLKTFFHSKNRDKIWWSAGYGFTNSSQFTFNYTLGYTFRLDNKKAKPLK